ncbi:calcium/sodium antiporter [Methanocaldococcus sp.]
MIEILYFFIGLIMLYYCSDWLILGSERVARYFKVSNFIIGATIIAFGTSFPEIITSVIAAYQKYSGIAVGNIIGSCICNIGLILGLSLIFSSIKIDNFLRRNLLFYLFYTLITLILGFDGFSFYDGIILLLGFLIYLKWSIKNDNYVVEDNKKEEDLNLPINIILVIIGLIGVLVGAELFVDGAVSIAHILHISDTIIGFTLVALGTSLPELAVSISAAKRRLGGMVLGNIVGSNIADIGGGIGLSTLFSNLPGLPKQLIILFIMSLILYIFSKKELNRKEGIILLLLYGLALYFIL